jgi:autotransporter-associated beta strand protein
MALFDWQFWSATDSGRKRRRRGERIRARRRALMVDVLESRLAPTVSTWSGAVSNLWSDSGNWDVPPTAGNDLVFPANAANLTNTDDLGAGTGFGSLTIAGSGYTIGGNAIALTGNLDSSQSSGSNTVDLPITASGSGPLAVTVDQSGAALVLGGVISGSSGLTMSGAGALDLAGANTYTGTTTVSGGVLNVDSAQPGSPVTLQAGATLGGSRTVGTITSTSATVGPGNPAPGVLTDSGDLTLDSGSSLSVALDGNTAGTGYSQLVVSGQVNLNGATLDATAGFTPADNQTFTIIDNTGTSAVSGTFAGLPQGAMLTISGQPYAISYTGGDGNDVVLTSLAASTTSVSASSNSVVSGQPVTLTATVAAADSTDTNTPTGSVQFFNGMTSLGSADLSGGTASLPNVVLPLGGNSITAQYSGDASFATSTATATTVTVTQATTTTSVMVAPNPSTLGDSVTLTATVAAVSPGSGTPTGSVEFLSGSASLGTGSLSGGVATLSTSSLPQGSSSITAQYEGDSNFSASNSPAMTATVNLASTTTLSASPASFTSGQTITLTATVAAAGSSSSVTPTGTVEFFNGSTSLGTATLSGGVATLSSVSLTATSALTATYDGDSNYDGSTSAAVTVSLVQTSTTTVTTAPNPSFVGQPVTLAAAVASGTGVPTGTVMFLAGGIPLGTVELDSTGSAILTVTTLPVGADAITAQYSGDSSATSSTSAAVTQTVSLASSTTTLTVAPLNSNAGQSVTLSVSVAAVGPGAGTPTGTVTFLNGAAMLGTASLDANGNASLATALPVGTNSITAQYSGDSSFASSTSAAVTQIVSQVTPASSVTLSASMINPGAFTAVQFTANITSAGSAVTGIPTGAVVFFANGVVIGSATLDGNGNGSFSTSSLAVGNDTITAVYQGDSNFSGSTSTPLSLTVGTSDEVFVNQIYLSVLDRPAEQGGLEAWTTALQDGLSRAKVVRLIIDSPESKTRAQETVASAGNGTRTQYLTARSSNQFKEQRIDDLYQAILGRQADPAGLQFFIDVVDNGFGSKQITIDLLCSDEYYSDITDALQSDS